MSYVFRTVKFLQRMVSLKMAQASCLFPAPTRENVIFQVKMVDS